MSTQTAYYKAGATSQTVHVMLVQNAGATSPGNALTGLAFNTSSLTAYYKVGATGTLTAITLATQTATGAYSSGGFVEISSTNAPGMYRLDIPDAVIASAGEAHIVLTGAANLATHQIKLVCSPSVNVESYGGTAGTFASGIPSVNINLPVGAIPSLGIIDNGTAQAVNATTLTMRSAASFGDNVATGATVMLTSGANAYATAVVTSNVGSTDVLTMSGGWSDGSTPTGTPTYVVFGTAPVTAGTTINANVTKWNGTTVATPATAGIPDVNVKNVGNQTASASGTVTFPNATIASTTNITGGTITTVTNLTNAPTAGDFTATMKTSIGTAVAASAVASVTGDVNGNVVGTVAGVTPATTASILTTALTESYAADGAAGTLSQILFGIQAFLQERAVAGTTLTVKKLDGSTTAMTFTLDDATAPTSLTRAT